jgi:hypothetical protein
MTKVQNTIPATADAVTARAPEQNGIKSPKRAGFISMAWDLFDSAESYIYNAQCDEIAERTGLNAENLRIELRRWKRFNGIETGKRAA